MNEINRVERGGEDRGALLARAEVSGGGLSGGAIGGIIVAVIVIIVLCALLIYRLHHGHLPGPLLPSSGSKVFPMTPAPPPFLPAYIQPTTALPIHPRSYTTGYGAPLPAVPISPDRSYYYPGPGGKNVGFGEVTVRTF